MPFIRRYRGGIYPTGKLPPCVCFVLFSCFVFPHDHQRPSQTTETVHNCFSGPSLDRRNVLCGERAVLHRFLRFSRALSLESSLSAHSCRLIKRKSTTSCLGRSFDHPFYSRVTEPRNFSPSAARLHPSHSFVRSSRWTLRTHHDPVGRAPLPYLHPRAFAASFICANFRSHPTSRPSAPTPCP